MWPFGSTKSTPISTSNANNQASSSSSASDIDKCPVDHETRSIWLAQNQSSGSKNPHEQQSSVTSSALTFLSAGGSKTDGNASSSTGMEGTITSDRHKAPGNLSTDREVSSIPRFGSQVKGQNDSQPSTLSEQHADPSLQSNWVYPSPAQFYSAMSRKNHNPQEKDMNVVVPIHNAVNERAWKEILQWEFLADKGISFNQCGGPQLVSFKGKPKQLTWRAWFKSNLMGYQKPFDRHDWEVDRCGKRIKYIIDFYTGHSSASGLSFYLDVRPSPADWEGIRMRFMRFFSKPEKRPLPAQSKI